MKERELQKAAAKFLDTVLDPAHARWFHPANGGLRTVKTAALMKAMGVKAGIADIVLLWLGRVAFIELKTDKGRLSPAQIEFAGWCDLNGFAYYTCRSLSEIEAVLRRLDVPTRLTPWRRVAA